MVVVGIIGAGLAGMSCAYYLLRAAAHQGLGIRVIVFEGRSRVGGRTFTHPDIRGEEDAHIDLGASWIWPNDNPHVTRLAKELGLKLVPEPDSMSYRFRRGSQSLALEIEKQLREHGQATILLDCLVNQVMKSASSIDVHYTNARDGRKVIQTVDTVVMAVPPRLVAETIIFVPELSKALRNHMEQTRTWMAQQGKFVLKYEVPFWKSKTGGAGSSNGQTLYWAQVKHRTPGPLDMIFDNGNVLWGFLSTDQAWRSLPDEQRAQKVLGQIKALFGENELAMNPLATFGHNWLREPLTCSKRDAMEPHPWRHPEYRDQATHYYKGHWDASLWFVGSETATTNAGFLDGAVESSFARVPKIAEALVKRSERGSTPDHSEL